MKKIVQLIALVFVLGVGMADVSAQSGLSRSEVSVNAFRNPSIGGEYRFKFLSVHAGYYTTAFESGIYTNFLRTGISFWFLPIGKRVNPSSFYTGVSYARGLTREYDDKNAVMGEAGFRWMVWKGLNLRIGVAALAAKDENVKINPTPGVSYSFFFD